MVEDAAEEERFRRLRHAIALRYRYIGHCASDHRKLPDAAAAAERARDRAPDISHLSSLWPQRPADRDSRARDAEARLLLSVAPRQPAVRARPWRSRARLLRGVLQNRSSRNARVLAEHGRDGFLAAWLRLRNTGWAADLIPDLRNL